MTTCWLVGMPVVGAGLGVGEGEGEVGEFEDIDALPPHPATIAKGTSRRVERKAEKRGQQGPWKVMEFRLYSMGWPAGGYAMQQGLCVQQLGCGFSICRRRPLD